MHRAGPSAAAAAWPALRNRRASEVRLWVPRRGHFGGVAARTGRQVSPRPSSFATSCDYADQVPEGVHLPGVEFTFTPYVDVPELEFGRDRQFCLLTLKHPSLEGTDEEKRLGLWAQKRDDRSARIERIFEKCDLDQSQSLDSEQLRTALNLIGMPATEDWVHGLFQRHNKKNDGRMLPNEFVKVVNEAWGRVPDPSFCDQFTKVHPEITGMHGYSFIGRESPASWTLRVVRNLWPFALKRVAILQNKYENPRYERHLMETIVDTYEGAPNVRGLTTAMDLAMMASEKHPEAKGGLVLRVVPSLRGALQWPEGGASTFIPFRGFAENTPGMMGKVSGWFKTFRK